MGVGFVMGGGVRITREKKETFEFVFVRLLRPLEFRILVARGWLGGGCEKLNNL